MTMLTGAKALVEILNREGVEYVLGIPGHTELPILDALDDHPKIKYIVGLHESVAIGVAEGYAKASGKVGVTNLHTAPGLAAGIPYLYNAHRNGTPMLITAGQMDSRLLAEEPELSGNLEKWATPFTKWSTEITHAADIPLVLQRAFKVAKQPPTGPVFVSVPVNIQNETLDFEYSPSNTTFAWLRSNQESLDTASKLLAEAQKPLIVVGARAAKEGVMLEIVRLAELIGARVYQHWVCDVNIPTDHPQYLGDLCELGYAGGNVGELLQSIDTLVVIGIQLFKQMFNYPKYRLNPSTMIIQVDDDPWEMAKNFSVTAGLGGDIKASLAELNDALEKKMTTRARETAGARAKEIAVEKNEQRQKQVQEERDNVPIAVSRLMQELSDSLKPGTVVVDESWSSARMLRASLNLTEPDSYHRVRGGGVIGWGMPFSVGIKLALPERPVVAVVGDGSAIFSFQSLWVAAHNSLPVTFIICSNGSYHTIKMGKARRMGGQAQGNFSNTSLDEPRMNFAQLAEALGVWGQRVERPEELKEVLKSALESDKPALVEVMVDDAV